MILPHMPYPRGTAKFSQSSFPGLDRRDGAGNGAICGMENMWSGLAPLLASRPARYWLQSVTKPNGLFSDGERLFLVDGTTLYVDGEAVSGTLTDSRKVFAALGKRIVIFPDKKLWTETDGLKDLESTTGSISAVFKDGTYAGVDAVGNTIEATSAGFDWSDYFSIGDAVKITGAADAENNKTPIIREIEGNELRFYGETFKVNETAQTITVTREVPDLDYICVNDNRVWGCKGDTICCSKLGDPFNWWVFDGVSTDSWSWETGTAGDFTGCVSFLGFPIFFKDEAIYKIYGSIPSNFEAMRSAATGVLPGAYRSLAVAGEVLYYLSRVGVMAYAGGMPSPIGDALASKYTTGVGGSDGTKYYLSAEYDGGTELVVWDSTKRVWHREDDLPINAMTWKKGLYVTTDYGDFGELWLIGTPPVVPEGAVGEAFSGAYAVFGEWDIGSFDGKWPRRLWLRAEAEEGVTLTVTISYDGGARQRAFEWEPGSKKTGYFPFPIRRCDRFSVKISADGQFKIYALEYELYTEPDGRK